jgi:uncharacterized cupredoxin-like copper-binding protein
LAFVVALLLCSLFVSASRSTVLAQDATPEASPAGTPCVAPDVPPGTPEPMEEEMTASPEASPAEASPVAEEPAPEPPVGTLVEDQAVIDEAEGFISNLFACINEGNYLGALAQTTDNFRETFVGTTNLYTAAAIVEEFLAGEEGTETITEFLGVYDNGDGSLSVDYQTAAGKQIFRYFEVLVQEGEEWKLDASFTLNAETDLDTISVGLKFASETDELVFEIAPASIEAMPATIFQVTNTGDWGHSFTLVKVPEGFDPASLTHPDPSADWPEGVEEIGGIYLEPGQAGEALFLDLEPGSYVIYCWVEAPDGETHADKGMYTTFTITEPVEIEVPDVVGTPAG